MRRVWFGQTVAAALVVVLIAVAGCSGHEESWHSPEGATAEVDADGFDISAGAVEVSGGPGVAPTGTDAKVVPLAQAIPNSAGEILFSAGEAAAITLDSGAIQPSTPLRVVFRLDTTTVQAQIDAGRVPALYLVSDDGSSADLISAEWDSAAGTLTAEVPHLTIAFPTFFDIAAFLREIDAAIGRALGLSYPKPDCVGKPVAGNNYSVGAVDHDVAWSCITAGDPSGTNRVTIGLHANTPYVWKVSTTPKPKTVRQRGVDIATYPAGALFKAILDNDNDPDTMLLPAGSVDLEFDSSATMPTGGVLSRDDAMYMVGLLGFGIGTALEKLNIKKYKELVEASEITRCFADVADSSRELGRQISGDAIGDWLKAVLGCISGAAAIVGFIFGPLGATILGAQQQSMAILNPRLSTRTANFTISSRLKATGKWTDPTVVVTTNSVGAVILGMSDTEIEAAANVTFEGRCTQCDSSPYVDLSPADQYPIYSSVTNTLNGYSDRSLRVYLRNGQTRSGQVVITDEGFRLGDSVQELRRIYGTRLHPYEVLGMYSIKGYKVDGPNGYIIFNTLETNGTSVHEFWVKQR
jgi:hypothetical protein